jgi:sulfonate transport system substrate-binding protein
MHMKQNRTKNIFSSLILAGSLVMALVCASPIAAGAAATRTPTIPKGVTLRIGDQLSYLQTVLSLAGQNTNFPYTVQYSSFIGGPPMLQAFQSGSLDAGFVGSTPLIFAQAASQPIQAVAGWATKHSDYSLVTSPGNTSIKGWANLKGKKVAYQQGTAGEAVLLEGLHSAKLSLSDITPILLPQTQIAAALQGGSADAGIEVEPSISVATPPLGLPPWPVRSRIDPAF